MQVLHGFGYACSDPRAVHRLKSVNSIALIAIVRDLHRPLEHLWRRLATMGGPIGHTVTNEGFSGSQRFSIGRTGRDCDQ
jgi:hypothetical protein